VFIKAFYLLIVILGSTGIPGDIRQEEPAGKPEIFIIGTIHSMHYNPDYHYSIADLQEQRDDIIPVQSKHST
jgi:hypothetical protein